MSCFRSKKKNSYTVNHEDSDYHQTGGKYHSHNVASRWDAAQNLGKTKTTVTNGNVEKTTKHPVNHSPPTNNRFHSDEHLHNEVNTVKVNSGRGHEVDVSDNGNSYKVVDLGVDETDNRGVITDMDVDIVPYGDCDSIKEGDIHLEDARTESPQQVNGSNTVDLQGNVVEIQVSDLTPPQHESPTFQHSKEGRNSLSSIEDDHEVHHESEVQHYHQDHHSRPPIVQVTAPSFEAEDSQNKSESSSEHEVEVVGAMAYQPVELESEEVYEAQQPESLNVNIVVPDSDDHYLDSPQGTWDGRLNTDMSAEIEKMSSSSSTERLEDLAEADSIPAPQEYTEHSSDHHLDQHNAIPAYSDPNPGVSVIHVSQLSIDDNDEGTSDDSPRDHGAYDFTQHQLHEQYENDKNEQLHAGETNTTTEYSYTSSVMVSDANGDGVPEVHTTSSHHTTDTTTPASTEAASIMY